MKTKQKPIASLEDFSGIDVESMAAAFEADAGESLPGLREALSEAQRGEFARVTTPEQMLLREARRITGLSQAEFARRIATPVTTLRGWEQGRFSPPGIATALARLITRHPSLAEELVLSGDR
ncbi:MAG: helix-turn-helix domain-containing protein [Candidatus Accumulibacter sp.]|jgi:putative transcriptional regulator|nr:helix-turn-helix domain-containing protein [Accumulibacter sp.]